MKETEKLINMELFILFFKINIYSFNSIFFGDENCDDHLRWVGVPERSSDSSVSRFASGACKHPEGASAIFPSLVGANASNWPHIAT